MRAFASSYEGSELPPTQEVTSAQSPSSTPEEGPGAGTLGFLVGAIVTASASVFVFGGPWIESFSRIGILRTTMALTATGYFLTGLIVFLLTQEAGKKKTS